MCNLLVKFFVGSPWDPCATAEGVSPEDMGTAWRQGQLRKWNKSKPSLCLLQGWGELAVIWLAFGCLNLNRAPLVISKKVCNSSSFQWTSAKYVVGTVWVLGLFLSECHMCSWAHACVRAHTHTAVNTARVISAVCKTLSHTFSEY